jgi:hypothetical protein
MAYKELQSFDEFSSKARTLNQPGLESTAGVSRQGLNLDAHLQLGSICERIIDANPARLQSYDKKSLSKVACDFYDVLVQSNLTSDQAVKTISQVFSQTMPSGRMEANNISPGKDRNGKLTITDSFNGRTVLDSLKEASVNPELFTSLMLALENSKRIDQGIRNTCSVTCNQSHQMVENPAVIVGRISDLITKGKSLNPDGSVALELPINVRGGVNELYQAAMMNAVPGGYDASSDIVNGKMGRHPGLYASELCSVLNKASGTPHRVLYQGDSDYRPVIDGCLDQRQSVIAVVQGIGAGTHMWHDVRVVDRKGGDIYFINPWPDEYIKNGNGIEVLNKESGLCRMSEKTFLGNTQYLVYETNNLKDFKFVPDGRDERGAHPEENRAAVFTVELDEDVLELLKRLKRISADLMGDKDKIGNENKFYKLNGDRNG